MNTQSLFKMDSVSEMIAAAGEQDRDFNLAYPNKYVGYSLERMKSLIAEYNTNRLTSCRIAKGLQVTGFCTVEDESEAEAIINSRTEEVTAVAERIMRCIAAGIDLV